MNVMLINMGAEHTYPTGLGAISAFLKKNGHPTRLLDLVVDGMSLAPDHFDVIRKGINDFKPGIVGFTVFETGFHWAKSICDFIKGMDPGIKTVAGGYYPTLAPDEVIGHGSIDVICRGEGEHALLELAEGLEKGEDLKDIKNLWVKTNGAVYKNEIRPLIEDLDSLPFWDREMFDYQAHLNLSKKGDRNVKVMASRGCPYHCTYCSNFYFKGLYPNKNKYLRMRSVGSVIEELASLKKNFDFEYVGFHDDNLTLFTPWLEEFSSRYPKEVGMPFYCAARPETCSDKNLELLKKAGCFMVLIGLECGDEDYRRKMMNRKMTNRLIIEVCRRLKKHGILIWTFNMVGMPGETRKHILKTVLLNWRIGPDFAMTSIFYPFRGTEMGDLCYREGLVNLKKKEVIGSYANDSILDHPNISTTEMKIAKYLTIFSAMRSRNGFFYNELMSRAKKMLSGG